MGYSAWGPKNAECQPRRGCPDLCADLSELGEPDSEECLNTAWRIHSHRGVHQQHRAPEWIPLFSHISFAK